MRFNLANQSVYARVHFLLYFHHPKIIRVKPNGAAETITEGCLTERRTAQRTSLGPLSDGHLASGLDTRPCDWVV